MTQSAFTRTSPSSSSLISTPGVGGPTVPSLIRSGGLMVPSPQVSDIPQSSPTGMPIAWKNSSTSSGVGAGPAGAARGPAPSRRPPARGRFFQSELLAQLGEHLLVRLCRCLGDLGRHFLAGLLGSHLGQGSLQTLLGGNPLVIRETGQH